MPGSLFIVATPIGNLSDITLRALETLKTCDIVACEDTRRTEQLMRHFEIRKPLYRYDEHTHRHASLHIKQQLLMGKNVALVTDAGTPAISDPGSRLVQEVVEAGLAVVPIPGASSPIAALSASGWGGEGFVFMGFLPRRPGRAKRLLQEAARLGKTVVILESPYRVAATVKLISELWPHRSVILAREITKIHEEFIRGEAESLQRQLDNKPLKGEFVLLIGPDPDQEQEIEPE